MGARGGGAAWALGASRSWLVPEERTPLRGMCNTRRSGGRLRHLDDMEKTSFGPFGLLVSIGPKTKPEYWTIITVHGVLLIVVDPHADEHGRAADAEEQQVRSDALARRTYVEGKAAVDAVPVLLDGEREDEAPEDEGDDVEDMPNAGKRNRGARDATPSAHGVRDPPTPAPRACCAQRGARLPAEAPRRRADQKCARQRARRDGHVPVGEHGPERGAGAPRRGPVVVHGQQWWPRHVVRRALPLPAGASRIHGRTKLVTGQPCLRFAAVPSSIACFFEERGWLLLYGRVNPVHVHLGAMAIYNYT